MCDDISVGFARVCSALLVYSGYGHRSKLCIGLDPFVVPASQIGNDIGFVDVLGAGEVFAASRCGALEIISRVPGLPRLQVFGSLVSFLLCGKRRSNTQHYCCRN